MEEKRAHFLESTGSDIKKLISNATPETKKTFKQIFSQPSIRNLIEGL